MPKIKSRDKTKEQLQEELRKAQEEVAIQKWGIEKTLKGMKALVRALAKELLQKKEVVAIQKWGIEKTAKGMKALVKEIIQKKKEISEAKAKDEALLESIGDGVIATDIDGKIILMNKGAQTMLGWHPENMSGRLLYDAVSIEDEKGNMVPREKRPITLALKGTTTTGPSYYYLRKDKTKFPIAIVVTPVIIDKKIIGAVEIFRDITKEKEIDRAKSEFVSMASHQLRTPLTGIQWVAERFSKKEKLSPEGKRYLDDIIMATRRLATLIELLLNVTRIEEGKIGIVPRPVELVELVGRFLQECHPLGVKNSLTLQFEKHPATLEIISDENVLRNIIQSIVSNAIEYTPKDGRVDVLLEKKESTFLFTISDTGIGIPKKDQPFVFKKLFRGSNATTIKTDGTGLGLYIAYEATKLFNGKIWFESEENKGTTFYIELPLKVERRAGKKSLT